MYFNESNIICDVLKLKINFKLLAAAPLKSAIKVAGK